MDTSLLIKAANYCVYQERTQAEVRKRLREWEVFGDKVEQVIAYLITENYINEERYAKAFVGGKFRVKKWGKRKILFELKGKGLSKYCIESGMKEIDDQDYFDTIDQLIAYKKNDLRNEPNRLIKKQKTVKYLVGKGFEMNLVLDQYQDD